MSCEDCPLSLSCWSGALMGSESNRHGYPKNVEDRRVWQEGITLCPVCEQLCIITYKWGEAIEAFNCGAYTFPGRTDMRLQPGDAYYFQGVHVGTVMSHDGIGVTVSRRGLDNEKSSPLDGQDFTFERHRCEGRTQLRNGWAVWYQGYINEGPLYVVREVDSAPSAHPGDHIWVKLCPECFTDYLERADARTDLLWTKNELCLLAPGAVQEGTRVWGLKTAMLNTKAEAVPGWSDDPYNRTFWPSGCPYPDGVYHLEKTARYDL